jgi:Protein of unknown function (DUF2808)
MMKMFPNLRLKLVVGTIAAANFFISTTMPIVIANEIQKDAPKDILEPSDFLRLISVRASEITVGTRNIEYTFTINVPKSSGAIEKVSIAQRGGLETIRFNQSKIKAYGSSKEQRNLTITQVDINPDTQGLTATFDPPVQPGQTFRLVLGVNENPFSDGNYLFNVAVYAQGKSDVALSLGVARLRITSIR